ncbi:SdpI family protein [Clostridium psychrophilum]|uniref:SdpI family protein n=1 Tax=Clostridium psychrophilum TaxID=132926 RepID=UPI001C0DEB50|nr:SdpI family protein [Clostridium psychrophilum]MBU3182960.1 SdpI family protein [Clostridium psychrophilum]
MSFLIVAIVFIVLGFILMKYPSKIINSIIGYRTLLSMRNQDTWDISQKHCGSSLIIFGVINGIWASWSIIKPTVINNHNMQGALILLSVISIVVIEEIHLMKLFNRDGSRKKYNDL